MSSYLTTATLVASPAREPVELSQGGEVFTLLTEDVTFQSGWDALYRDCPWATVFQSRDFVATWYQVYQSKYRPVLLQWHTNGRLSGLLALAMPWSGTGLPGGRLVGAGQYDAEYQTWLARPEEGDDFMPLVLEKLRQVLPNHHLQLRFLPPATPLAWLRRSRMGGQRIILQPYRRPLMQMADPELPRLFRKPEFRNKLNRLKRLGEVHFEQVTEVKRFSEVLPGMALQYDFRQGALFNKNQFRDDPLKVKLLLSLFRLHLLHVTVLRVQQEIVAAIVAVKSGNWIHLGGINVHAPLYANYSPGFVHFLLLGQQLSREQVAVFDLTPGQDAYKERLATCHDQVYELMVSGNLRDFLHKNMRKSFHGLLVYLGRRPMSVHLGLQKTLYLLRHRLEVSRRQGWLRTCLYLGRQYSSGDKTRWYVFKSRPEAQQGMVRLQENNLSDLLEYDPKQNMPSRWEFLEQAMRCFGQEGRSFTYSENSCLLACAWIRLPGTWRAENYVSPGAEEAPLVQNIYCHPAFRNQFRRFMISLVVHLNNSLNVSSIYARIPPSDNFLEQALRTIGFSLFYPGTQAPGAQKFKC